MPMAPWSILNFSVSSGRFCGRDTSECFRDQNTMGLGKQRLAPNPQHKCGQQCRQRRLIGIAWLVRRDGKDNKETSVVLAKSNNSAGFFPAVGEGDEGREREKDLAQAWFESKSTLLSPLASFGVVAVQQRLAVLAQLALASTSSTPMAGAMFGGRLSLSLRSSPTRKWKACTRWVESEVDLMEMIPPLAVLDHMALEEAQQTMLMEDGVQG
eukprot:1812218-Amphidinium_carterae.1